MNATAETATSPDWKVLSQPALPADPGTAPSILCYAMLRADAGVALIDIAPAHASNAAMRFRTALGRVGFGAIYPGYLPVVYLQLDAWKFPSAVEKLVAAVMENEPPMSCTDPGWIDMAARVLTGRTIDAPALASPRAQDRMEIVPSQPPASGPRRATKVAAGVGLAMLATSGAGLIAYKADPDALTRTAQRLVPSSPAPVGQSVAPDEPSPPPETVQTPPVPTAAEPAAPPSEAAAPATQPPAAQAAPPPPPPAADALQAMPTLRAGDISPATAIARADALMRQHSIEDARAWYGRAYRAGDGTAAVSLGMSYDPFFLVEIGERDLANQREALAWYAKARAIGGERVTLMLKLVEARRSQR